MVKKPGKKRSFKARLNIALLCFFLAIVLILLYLNFVVNPVIIDATESKVRSLTQKAVGTAIHEVIKGNSIYDELVTITRNNEGDIAMISSNAFKINILSRELLDNAQKKLDLMGEQGVDVGLLTFTGLPIFANRGPQVNIKMLPIGTIYTRFRSEFSSAGINQTNHKIYLVAETNVSIILPTANKKVQTITEILITESIIVGKIPEVYLNSNNLDEMLNLIP